MARPLSCGRESAKPAFAVINDLSGVGWTTDRDGEHEALRLLVTANEVATAYASFVLDESHAAQQLRRWMREVPEEQTFGVRESQEPRCESRRPPSVSSAAGSEERVLMRP